MIRKVKQGSAYNIPVHDYIMDSSNEVGDLPTNVPQGSTAYAINDGSQFILDSEGNWQPMLDTGRDLILLELSKKYTDDSILGLETEVEWLMDLQRKTPIIDEVTKTWFVYDAIEEEYKDTGIVAEGKDGKDGKDGSDANVTNTNVVNALGYIPLSEDSLPSNLETTTGSQAKATQALNSAKSYVDGKVLTDVPINAIFTDTVVDISGKADKTYVDGLIGDINSALDMINGEVI